MDLFRKKIPNVSEIIFIIVIAFCNTNEAKRLQMKRTKQKQQQQQAHKMEENVLHNEKAESEAQNIHTHKKKQ